MGRQRQRRCYGVSNRVKRDSSRPRLSVFRSVQTHVCPDHRRPFRPHAGGVAAPWTRSSALSPATAATNCRGAAVGKILAQRALQAGIKQVALDRRSYKYHGRVAALAKRRPGSRFGILIWPNESSSRGETEPRRSSRSGGARGPWSRRRPPFQLRGLIVVGDGRGKVGWGYGRPTKFRGGGKGRQGRQPQHDGSSPGGLHHSAPGDRKFGASSVVLLPAGPGTGVIAGSAVRAVCECSGIHDILTKSFGSTNPINLVKATMEALKQLRTRDDVERLAGSLAHMNINEANRGIQKHKARKAIGPRYRLRARQDGGTRPQRRRVARGQLDRGGLRRRSDALGPPPFPSAASPISGPSPWPS